MKRLKLVCLSLLCSASLPAMAQLGLGQTSSVRAGVFFPTSGEGRDIGSTWTTFGLDARILRLRPPGIGLGAGLETSIDYLSRGGSWHAPLMLNARLELGENSFAGGAGVAFGRARGERERVDTVFQLSARRNILGGPLPAFVEGRYYFSARPSLRGLTVMVGVRF